MEHRSGATFRQNASRCARRSGRRQTASRKNAASLTQLDKQRALQQATGRPRASRASMRASSAFTCSIEWYLIRESIRGHQRSSEAIIGHQRRSESVAISGDQWRSEAIRGDQFISGHRWPSEAIRGHLVLSVAISGHQRPSEAI